MIHNWIRTAAVALIAAVIVWCAIPVRAFLDNQAKASKEVPGVVSQLKDTIVSANDTLGSLKKTITGLDGDLNGKHGLRQVLYNIDLASAQFARMSTTLEVASKEEHTKALQASDSLTKSINDLDTLVVATKTQLDEGTLPALTATLNSTTTALDKLDGPNGLIVQGTAAVKAAGAILGDPHIPTTMAHVDAILASSETSSKEISEGLGYINGYLKPAKTTFRSVLISKGVAGLLEFGIQTLVRRLFPERVEIAH
jgi:hypothetical protein